MQVRGMRGFSSLPRPGGCAVHNHAAAMQPTTKQSNLIPDSSTAGKGLPVGHVVASRPLVIPNVIQLHRPAA